MGGCESREGGSGDEADVPSWDALMTSEFGSTEYEGDALDEQPRQVRRGSIKKRNKGVSKSTEDESIEQHVVQDVPSNSQTLKDTLSSTDPPKPRPSKSKTARATKADASSSKISTASTSTTPHSQSAGAGALPDTAKPSDENGLTKPTVATESNPPISKLSLTAGSPKIAPKTASATGSISPTTPSGGKQVVVKEEVVSEEVIRRDVDPVTGKVKKTKVIVVRKVIKEFVRKNKPAGATPSSPTATASADASDETVVKNTPQNISPQPTTSNMEALTTVSDKPSDQNMPAQAAKASSAASLPIKTTGGSIPPITIATPEEPTTNIALPVAIHKGSEDPEIPLQSVVIPKHASDTVNVVSTSRAKSTLAPEYIITSSEATTSLELQADQPSEETKEVTPDDDDDTKVFVVSGGSSPFISGDAAGSTDSPIASPDTTAILTNGTETITEAAILNENELVEDEDEDEDEDDIDLPPRTDYLENPIFARLGVEENKVTDYSDLMNRWDEGDASIVMVRGKNYMKDNKKVTAEPQAFRTLGTVVIGTDKPLGHAAAALPKLKTYLEEQSAHYPFFFIANWQLPGKPSYSVVQVAGRVMPRGEDPVFDNLLDRFVASDAAFRDERIKFLCLLQDAPSLVRGAMSKLAGNKPALIGNKLKCKHFTGRNYVEVDIDVGSSWIASMLNSVIYNNASSLGLTMGFMIEGRSLAELPERLITWSKFIHVSPKEVSQDYFGPLEQPEDRSAHYRRRYVHALAQGEDPTANNNLYAR